MAALMPPFRATSMAGLSQKVCKGVYDPVPASYSPDLSQFIKSCLQINPVNRPTCETLLKMPGVRSNLSDKLELMR